MTENETVADITENKTVSGVTENKTVRDIGILAVLIVALLGLGQFTQLDVTGTMFNGLANSYTIVNNCAGDIVLESATTVEETVVSGDTVELDPRASTVLRYQPSEGEYGDLEIKINGDLTVIGAEIPADSDIFGRNPTIVACPVDS